MSTKPKKDSPLTMRDREELLEMVTNLKLIAMKLSLFHNKNIFHPKSPEYMNQSMYLQKFSQILSMIEKSHSEV